MANEDKDDASPSTPPGTVSDRIKQLIIYLIYIASQTNFKAQERPLPLLRLSRIAADDEGWCEVVMGIITFMPLAHPLTMPVIDIILDYSPLPDRNLVVAFIMSLQVSAARAPVGYASLDKMRIERNLLLVLSSIAEQFTNKYSYLLLRQDVLHYLLVLLVQGCNPLLVEAALVVLERLSGTLVNRAVIGAGMARLYINPLLTLEMHHDSNHFLWRRVGFAASWILDNLYPFPGRKCGYETVKTDHINVMLNAHERTNNLKISPNGLEARSDSHSLESVRATFEMTSGSWYYEVEMVTSGIMKIGFAMSETVFDNHAPRFWTLDGFGVGDDESSIAYDGCRRLVWHRAIARRLPNTVERWRSGDVLGVFVDIERQQVIFSLNGLLLDISSPQFLSRCSVRGIYPAASFTAHQQCIFNFGERPFYYPPINRIYSNMNVCGILSIDEKMILPRHVEIELLERRGRVAGGRRCLTCGAVEAYCTLQPCQHSGFCAQCALKFQDCPHCNEPVWTISGLRAKYSMSGTFTQPLPLQQGSFEDMFDLTQPEEKPDQRNNIETMKDVSYTMVPRPSICVRCYYRTPKRLCKHKHGKPAVTDPSLFPGPLDLSQRRRRYRARQRPRHRTPRRTPLRTPRTTPQYAPQSTPYCYPLPSNWEPIVPTEVQSSTQPSQQDLDEAGPSDWEAVKAARAAGFRPPPRRSNFRRQFDDSDSD